MYDIIGNLPNPNGFTEQIRIYRMAEDLYYDNPQSFGRHVLEFVHNFMTDSYRTKIDISDDRFSVMRYEIDSKNEQGMRNLSIFVEGMGDISAITLAAYVLLRYDIPFNLFMEITDLVKDRSGFADDLSWEKTFLLCNKYITDDRIHLWIEMNWR